MRTTKAARARPKSRGAGTVTVMRARSCGSDAVRHAALFAALVAVGSPRETYAQAPPVLPPPPPPPPGSSPPPAPRTLPREPPQRESPSRETTPRRELPPAHTHVTYAPPPVAYERSDRPEGPPPAHTGFQAAARIGYALPIGSISAASRDSSGNHFGGQIPILFDLGAKVTPSFFLGGYIGFAFGSTGGDFRAACDSLHASCSSSSFRLGAQVHYQFQPAERLNPWIGYGIGFESASATRTVLGTSSSDGYSGVEFARLSGGLDIRLSRTIALGPTLDLSFGQYNRFKHDINGVSTSSELPKTALHEWLSIGIRATLFP